MRAAGERLLDAAVLVAERDLEVQHLLARALEAEVPRLDDAGVHRPDGDLVDLAALHAEELAVGRARRPSIARTGFSHGWPSGISAVLLPDFALEEMRLRRASRSATG